MRIGYCTTDVSRGLIAQITGSHTYHAATYLSADVLNKYVGDKIESIEFAISLNEDTWRNTLFVPI